MPPAPTTLSCDDSSKQKCGNYNDNAVSKIEGHALFLTSDNNTGWSPPENVYHNNENASFKILVDHPGKKYVGKHYFSKFKQLPCI